MNILLIEDHELFREGLKLLLADLGAAVRFHESGCCDAALAVLAREPVELVLLDLHLPGCRGLDGLAAIRAAAPAAIVVVLSAEDDPMLIRGTIDAGAAGFIPKGASHAVMKAALRLVQAGGTYLPPSVFACAGGEAGRRERPPAVTTAAPAGVAGREPDGAAVSAAACRPAGGALPSLFVRTLPPTPWPSLFASNPPPQPETLFRLREGAGDGARISPRQLEIVRRAIQGKPNKIIARELDIAEATVKAHLSAAYRAMGVRNRTEAVFAAARYGALAE